MARRLLSVAILFAFASIGAVRGHESPCLGCDLTVHEWGTFTSIAGDDGSAVDWSPLDGTQDLPCFVERYRFNIKGWISGTVRMETPVLYFYSEQKTTVSASVSFRQGMVTEWYPHADVMANGDAFKFADPAFSSTIRWAGVTVSPGQAEHFATEDSSSHYYAARQTDAAPLRAGSQAEKFLFYRGIGGFQPPISAAVNGDGSVLIRNVAGGAVGDIVLFENRGGTMAYAVQHVGAGQITAAAPVLAGNTAPPSAELERVLIANGLYPREAQAMVATWRDSWFEEGARLIYIAPRAAVDAILPLTVTPQPASVARVFVGRIELVTARTKQDVKTALLNDDHTTLARYGRFLRPIADRVMRDSTSAESARLVAALKTAPAPAVGTICR
jgi:hypothetical protein